MAERTPASESPFIETAQYEKFCAWCESKGHATRIHPDIMRDGCLVKVGKHWMGVLYNRGLKRYTIDKRMRAIVAEFKASSSC